MTLPEAADHQPESAAPETEAKPSAVLAETAPDSAPPAESIELFEALTLAQAAGRLWRSPRAAGRALAQVMQTPQTAPLPAIVLPEIKSDSGAGLAAEDATPAVAVSAATRAESQREVAQLGMRLGALLIAVYGSSILVAERTEESGLVTGAPFLLAAFLLWLASEIYASWPQLSAWWRRIRRSETDTSAEDQPATSDMTPAQPAPDASSGARSLPRWALGSAALLFSLLTAAFNAGNQFTLAGVAAWGLSIGLWIFTFAPPGWSLGRLWAMAAGALPIRRSWTLWVLLLIMALGALFRVSDIARVPPEMTSDHVEKLLDAQRVLDGNPQVFFPNNGGREPLQMYAMALFSKLPGLSMDFTTLKLLSALEGILTIPVMWWLGREIAGSDKRRFGNLLGLALAALVAVSYWHVALSRIGLRIILTPLVTALLIIFLGRALRHNRRGDFILAGLVLGFGLYTYQAARMLPVVVVVGVILALLFWARSLRERRRYLTHLVVLVMMSVAVFVPLLMFSLQYPNLFWMRTSGRLMGDDIIQTTNERGELIEREATLQERLEAFSANLPVLMSNIRNALLMYNWKGDVLWFNAVPNRPAMDVFTGSLLIVGLAAWLARLIRRRDVLEWLLPLLLLIMLLPSAFAIAYPIENPSATRMSGTLPAAYLFAALPLALLVESVWRLMRGWLRPVMAGCFGAGIVLLAFFSNSGLYFRDYYQAYLNSSPAPYTEAGRILRGFADSGGALGNAFMIHSKYWWDHRAVGMEAGVMDWPNGIGDPDGELGPRLPVDDVPRWLYRGTQRTDRYRFDPEKDILFFYAIDDTVTEPRLLELFPEGYSQRISSYKPNDDYFIFRVPRLGGPAFLDFVIRSGAAG